MKIILSISSVIIIAVIGVFFYFHKTTNPILPEATSYRQQQKGAAFVFLSEFDGIPAAARANLKETTFSFLGSLMSGYQTSPLSENEFEQTSLLQYGFRLNEDSVSDGTLRSSAAYEQKDIICLVETSAEMLNEDTVSDLKTTLTCGSR